MPRERHEPTPPGAVVYTTAFFADDESFLRALRAGHRGARSALFDRYADHVERVLTRVLGLDGEIQDLLQEVFLRAIAGLDGFRGEAEALRPWLTRITVFTARGCIRKRQARRWLRLHGPETMPEPAAGTASPEIADVLRRAQRVLDKLPTPERIPFVLRHVEDMELTEVADACAVSVATVKRRLIRARRRFERLAAHDPVLVGWLGVEEGPS